MKFISNKGVKIEEKYYIENILNYLKDKHPPIFASHHPPMPQTCLSGTHTS